MSKPHAQHKVFPSLLRHVSLTEPNQVWSTDITNIRLARACGDMVAFIDRYIHKVLSWRISNSVDATIVCLDRMGNALGHHNTLNVFDSDEGSQFTTMAVDDVLKGGHTLPKYENTIGVDQAAAAKDSVHLEIFLQLARH